MYSSVSVTALGDLTCLFADLFSDACIIAKTAVLARLRSALFSAATVAFGHASSAAVLAALFPSHFGLRACC